ncbi:hypothetical protein ABZ722_27275 [Streptomyces longwoodensis]|uniref:hypothetical protein n=1 Tax=Streptomyces longwoodensis TaxID=68231 RepID=UPI0033EA6E39
MPWEVKGHAGRHYAVLFHYALPDDAWAVELKEPPSAGITAYVTALLEQWCDITEDKDGTSPWSVGPLIDAASGPLIYFGMGWGKAEEASVYAAGLADSMGLNCFDVQQDRLRP